MAIQSPLLAQDCNLCALHLMPLQMLQVTEVVKLTKYIPSMSRNLISCTHKVQSYYKSTTAMATLRRRCNLRRAVFDFTF